MAPNLEGLEIRPSGQKTRSLTAEEFERAVARCVLNRSPHSKNRDHLFNNSCDLAISGWSRRAVNEFRKEVLSRIGESPTQA